MAAATPTGGSGGYADQGGAGGGCLDPANCVRGDDGSTGQGGNGALPPPGSANAGGGGGGGGGLYGGGGGGTSLPEASQSPEYLDWTFGGAGGGGTGLGPVGAFTANFLLGDGYATVSFMCPAKK